MYTLLRTVAQNFDHILKLVTFMCIPWTVMFLGFINTKISK